jgi:hypothetical protein
MNNKALLLIRTTYPLSLEGMSCCEPMTVSLFVGLAQHEGFSIERHVIKFIMDVGKSQWFRIKRWSSCSYSTTLFRAVIKRFLFFCFKEFIFFSTDFSHCDQLTFCSIPYQITTKIIFRMTNQEQTYTIVKYWTK